jgi:hypothetical protein
MQPLVPYRKSDWIMSYDLEFESQHLYLQTVSPFDFVRNLIMSYSSDLLSSLIRCIAYVVGPSLLRILVFLVKRYKLLSFLECAF